LVPHYTNNAPDGQLALEFKIANITTLLPHRSPEQTTNAIE
jgi:hypothetical protein